MKLVKMCWNFDASILVVVLISICAVTEIGAPPVDQKKQASTDVPPETASQEAMYNVEYERYLQEVVQLLESDDDFKKKLEKADPEDIKSGKIAEELDFLNHNIRSKLHEIKRREIERLREAIREQVERENGAHNVVMPNHIDHNNLDTFEIEDLRKLILQTTKDLEELDKKRRSEFKEYEMEKEIERRQKMENMTEEEKQKAEKEFVEQQQKHAEHPKVKHPGSKDQLEEVWQNVDNLPKESFDPKTFFNLHDLTGDGYLDIAELEALFQKELDKVYDKNAPEDDMKQRDEEMSRMREHVMKEMDADKDGLISMDEFLGEVKKPDFKEDPGWKTVDEQPVYSQEEFAKFQEEWSKVHGVPPPAYAPPGYPQQGGQPLYPSGQHPGQPPYPGHQAPYPGGQPPYQGQQFQGQPPHPGQQYPPQGGQQPHYPPVGQLPSVDQQANVQYQQHHALPGQQPPQAHVPPVPAHQQQVPEQHQQVPVAQQQQQQTLPPAPPVPQVVDQAHQQQQQQQQQQNVPPVPVQPLH